MTTETVSSNPTPAESRRGLGRVTLEVRQRMPAWKHGLILALSLSCGLAIGVAVLWASGVAPKGIYEEFVLYTFFNAKGLANVLVECTPLILVGLSAALAFRVQFWNIGLEGQLILGGMGAAFFALNDIGPPETRLALMLLGGLAGGALWTVVPLLLKLKLNVNEIISTLLLNYVAFQLLQDRLYGAWQDPDRFPHSPQFENIERLPRIGFGDVDSGIWVALAAGVVVWWLIQRARIGLFMTFVGSNARMSKAIGLPVTAVVAGSVLLSGALSGLAGFVVVAGQEYRLTTTFSGGYLFSGIVIAFLARNNPLAAVVVAFLLGGLYVGGQSIQIFYNLPAGVIDLLQAIIVMSVTASELFVRYRIIWRRA
jgi:general nucleoside transport system permease protein